MMNSRETREPSSTTVMNDCAHILVVDDDREIRALLRDYLERSGFRTTGAADGQEARHALGHERIDLIILDLMLPNESGLEICRELRARSSIPVIMLTALGEEEDRVVGLEVGADDYVAKPFSPRELLGRVRAVLRRTGNLPRAGGPEVRAYRFAGWRLDMIARTLRCEAGHAVPVGGVDFRLLSILLACAPGVVTRSQLMELMHGRDFDPLDRRIDVRVSRLRQVLGEDARAPSIIRTVYGQGYTIGVPVEAE